jgi:predicted enzyme related to lactoylglutathione lyase
MLEQVEAAGGSRFMPRTPIPGMGWFALFNDPQGNVVGLFSLSDPPLAEQPTDPQ